MKVYELIAMLKCMPADAEVMLARNSGDYWRTEVCDEFSDGNIETVEWTEYHRCWKPMEEEKAYDYEDSAREEGIKIGFETDDAKRPFKAVVLR